MPDKNPYLISAKEVEEKTGVKVEEGPWMDWTALTSDTRDPFSPEALADMREAMKGWDKRA